MQSQFEPLRAPQSWGTEERRFVVQVMDRLDEAFRRIAQLQLAGMGETTDSEITLLKQEIAALKARVTVLEKA